MLMAERQRRRGKHRSAGQSQQCRTGQYEDEGLRVSVTKIRDHIRTGEQEWKDPRRFRSGGAKTVP
jgi:hypothetical protein